VETLTNLAHGVEFRHLKARRIVAFIVGFDWKHHPGSKATVQILKSADGVEGMPSSAILRETREAVELFFARGGDSRFRHGSVRVWFNA
jgi:hypothetical protein